MVILFQIIRHLHQFIFRRTFKEVVEQIQVARTKNDHHSIAWRHFDPLHVPEYLQVSIEPSPRFKIHTKKIALRFLVFEYPHQVVSEGFPYSLLIIHEEQLFPYPVGSYGWLELRLLP